MISIFTPRRLRSKKKVSAATDFFLFTRRNLPSRPTPRRAPRRLVPRRARRLADDWHDDWRDLRFGLGPTHQFFTVVEDDFGEIIQRDALFVGARAELGRLGLLEFAFVGEHHHLV